ncbi:DUF3189 family protein [Alteribacter populi]|uniref:DUF3189 family protein n=1 Tax=Alteribacter populi TaxID=2011011 RepID=UPI000BBB1384|nr:DUF3189 family protein [Alteribacter populi]
MIYIYNCFGGTHSSALAAAYHLKKIPADRTPTKEEILGVDIFNKLTPKDMGKIIFHGEDDERHPVYTVGRGRSKELIPAMRNLLLLLPQNNEEKVVFSNTSPTVPLPMTFGGLFSRRLHIDFIGVPLLVKGAQQTHPVIAQLVEKTREVAKTTTNSVEVLENKELEVNKLFG